MAAIVGEAGLPPADRRALDFAERFEREFVHQGTQRRSIAETLELGWRLLDRAPPQDLLRLGHALLEARAPQRAAAARAGASR